ncbi:hypothetical protein AB0F17_08700 [Nonomuraea sp. NPDC026600]|uniref:hypothetical protein n=1 Tax=Nonomuraea sp. NPDC026600 TaxID=3155363 RepID=UPI0034061EB0
MALLVAEAVRRTLRDAWTLIRPYRLAAAGVAGAVVLTAVVVGSGPLADTLIVSALVAIALANGWWWWFHDRDQQARLRRLRADLGEARAHRDQWAERATVAEEELMAAGEETASLKARNAMLTGLVGGERR